VDFDWKQHWADSYRVGDEGTDEEIKSFIQPIRNRVTVTREDAVVSSGMTDEQEQKLPRGGMAEGLLKHAVRFSLRNWLVASNNALLPVRDTPVHFESSTSGYKIQYKIKTFDVVMRLTRDMSLQSMGVEGPKVTARILSSFRGRRDFSWGRGRWARMDLINQVIALSLLTYQGIDVFQIPSQMVVDRESHHEVWRYKLGDCNVKTTK
jgi:hypothetical protein